METSARILSRPSPTYRVQDLSKSFQLCFHSVLLSNELLQRKMLFGHAICVATRYWARRDGRCVNVVHHARNVARIGVVDATRKVQAWGWGARRRAQRQTRGSCQTAPALALCYSLHFRHTTLVIWTVTVAHILHTSIHSCNELAYRICDDTFCVAQGTGVEVSYLMVTCSYRSTLFPYLPCGTTRVPWTLQQLQPRRRTLSTCVMLKWPFYVS